MKISEIQLAPDDDAARGPFFTKVLKDGTVRQLENESKGDFIIEYHEEIEQGSYWHYFTLMVYSLYENAHFKRGACDFESHCGYDRGPGRDALIRRMWYGKA